MRLKLVSYLSGIKKTDILLADIAIVKDTRSFLIEFSCNFYLSSARLIIGESLYIATIEKTCKLKQTNRNGLNGFGSFFRNWRMK